MVHVCIIIIIMKYYVLYVSPYILTVYDVYIYIHVSLYVLLLYSCQILYYTHVCTRDASQPQSQYDVSDSLVASLLDVFCICIYT